MNLYEKYHGSIKLQKRVISENDFTYRNTLSYIKKYIPKKGNVLDIGSATGTVSFFFASKGLKVDGIELSKNAVKFANLNNKKFGFKNIKFYNTSIESFKLNKKYDLITCFEVLEHVEEDLKMLKKTSKCMHKNSILVVTVPSLNAPLYKMGYLDNFDLEVGHLRRYTLENLRRIFKLSGLKIISEHKSEGIFRSFLFTNKILGKLVIFTRFKIINSLFTYIDKISLKMFGESQFIIISNKK